MGFEKIGIHVHEDGVSLELLKKARVIVCANCDTAMVKAYRANNPSAWIVWRKVYNEQAQHDLLRNPTDGAHRWYEQNVGNIEALKGPRMVFQGLNEIGSGQSQQLLEFELRRMTLLHDMNAGFAGGGWSVGVPSPEAYELFVPMFRNMREDTDVILRHNYWGSGETITNPWHTSPWLFPEVKAATGNLRWILGEIGRDFVKDANLPKRLWGKGGWHADGLSKEAYMAELETYNDALLMPEPLVIGGAVFDAGRGAEYWPKHEINSIWPDIDRLLPQPDESVPPVSPNKLGYPFASPARVSQPFLGHTHPAVDLAAPRSEDFADFHGTEVLATHSGQAYVGDSLYRGLYVVIENQEFKTHSSHLSEVLVKSGDIVEKGQPIGLVGYSGNTRPSGIRGTHLDLEVRPKPIEWNNGAGGCVDPVKYWQED